MDKKIMLCIYVLILAILGYAYFHQVEIAQFIMAHGMYREIHWYTMSMIALLGVVGTVIFLRWYVKAVCTPDYFEKNPKGQRIKKFHDSLEQKLSEYNEKMTWYIGDDKHGS
jgi:hypothetical protein